MRVLILDRRIQFLVMFLMNMQNLHILARYEINVQRVTVSKQLF